MENDVRGSDNRIVAGPMYHAMVDLLRCTTCAEVALPPVFSCGSGHNICVKCHRGRLEPSCTQCHLGHFPPSNGRRCRSCIRNVFRNLAMEKVLEKCKLLCGFSGVGCDFIGNGYQIAQHQPSCDFRTIPCPFCLHYLNVSAFEEHLRRHVVPSSVDSESDHLIEVNENFAVVKAPECIWLQYSNQNFFLRVENDIAMDTGAVTSFLFVSMLGVEASIEAWEAQVTLQNKKKRLDLSLKSPLTSIRLGVSSARQAGLGIALSPDIVKTYHTSFMLKVNLRLLPAERHDVADDDEETESDTENEWEGIMEVENPNFEILQNDSDIDQEPEESDNGDNDQEDDVVVIVPEEVPTVPPGDIRPPGQGRRGRRINW